jgi:hypothetical protein
MTLSKPPSAIGGGRAFELFFRKSEKRNPVSPVNPVQPLFFFDRINRIPMFFAQVPEILSKPLFASGEGRKSWSFHPERAKEIILSVL